MKYIIEHMEEGFSEWVILEYTQIIKDIGKDNLILTSLPPSTTEKDIPKRLLELGLQWTTKECVDIDGGIDKSKVCLLDPAAETDLTPQDKSKFDYFVFGGILGVIQELIVQDFCVKNMGSAAEDWVVYK